MSLLAAYMSSKHGEETLEEFLSTRVFSSVSRTTLEPDAEDAAEFDRYIRRYEALIEVERIAVEKLKEDLL